MGKNKGEKTKKVSRSPIKSWERAAAAMPSFFRALFWLRLFYTYAPRSATGRVYRYQIRLYKPAENKSL